MILSTARKSAAAFTLVELLVTLAVAAMLAALLFPALVQARQRSHLAVCASNLRQLGVAIDLYCQDWDGTLPAAPNGWDVSKAAGAPGTFKCALSSYAGPELLWRCPSDTWFAQLPAVGSAYATVGTSYVWHWLPDPTSNPPAGQSLARRDIHQPAAWWMMHDLEAWHGGMNELYQAAAFAMRRSHQASLDALFLDGHVRAYSPDQWACLMSLHPR